MKKLLLFLLFSTISFGQAIIDVRLVNPPVGHPVYINNNGFNPYQSNDAGLNAILSLYGITTSYDLNYIHPYPAYQQKTIRIIGVYPASLITDLTNYSSVIESAKVSSDGTYTDAIRLQLLNLTIGSPTGTNSGIIVTNDSGLNTIFQNYNVFYYTQTYPSSTVNSSLRYYDVVCNCDKNLLKTALINYTSVIQTTENIHGGLILSNNQFENPKPIISPNPFSNNFNIETDEIISNYSLFDISGKQLINTTSKTALDNLSSQLNSGVYFLNLELENGQKSNYKIVKK
jgi:hypothetical protein